MQRDPNPKGNSLIGKETSTRIRDSVLRLQHCFLIKELLLGLGSLCLLLRRASLLLLSLLLLLLLLLSLLLLLQYSCNPLGEVRFPGEVPAGRSDGGVRWRLERCVCVYIYIYMYIYMSKHNTHNDNNNNNN